MRLIDADALHYIMEDTEKPKQMDHIRRFMVDKAPTVDAKPIRHGHWEKIETSKIYYCQNTLPIYKCSFCHTPFVNVDLKDRYHYCPNCGALMDEIVDANKIGEVEK